MLEGRTLGGLGTPGQRDGCRPAQGAAVTSGPAAGSHRVDLSAGSGCALGSRSVQGQGGPCSMTGPDVSPYGSGGTEQVFGRPRKAKPPVWHFLMSQFPVTWAPAFRTIACPSCSLKGDGIFLTPRTHFHAAVTKRLFCHTHTILLNVTVESYVLTTARISTTSGSRAYACPVCDSFTGERGLVSPAET